MWRRTPTPTTRRAERSIEKLPRRGRLPDASPPGRGVQSFARTGVGACPCNCRAATAYASARSRSKSWTPRAGDGGAFRQRRLVVLRSVRQGALLLTAPLRHARAARRRGRPTRLRSVKVGTKAAHLLERTSSTPRAPLDGVSVGRDRPRTPARGSRSAWRTPAQNPTTGRRMLTSDRRRRPARGDFREALVGGASGSAGEQDAHVADVRPRRPRDDGVAEAGEESVGVALVKKPSGVEAERAGA